MSDPGGLTAGDKAQLTAILTACPELAALAAHVAAFADLMTNGDGVLVAAQASDEGPQFGRAAGGGDDDPVLQVPCAARGHHLAEGGHVRRRAASSGQ
jgi:hypothetical protein